MTDNAMKSRVNWLRELNRPAECTDLALAVIAVTTWALLFACLEIR
jgi:hypothetical protein